MNLEKTELEHVTVFCVRDGKKIVYRAVGRNGDEWSLEQARLRAEDWIKSNLGEKNDNCTPQDPPSDH